MKRRSRIQGEVLSSKKASGTNNLKINSNAKKSFSQFRKVCLEKAGFLCFLFLFLYFGEPDTNFI
jgi:hypothetical protein